MDILQLLPCTSLVTHLELVVVMMVLAVGHLHALQVLVHAVVELPFPHLVDVVCVEPFHY